MLMKKTRFICLSFHSDQIAAEGMPKIEFSTGKSFGLEYYRSTLFAVLAVYQAAYLRHQADMFQNVTKPVNPFAGAWGRLLIVLFVRQFQGTVTYFLTYS